MKLTYRDKVVLIALIAVIIAVLGAVFLIRPKYLDIKDDNAKLAEVKEKWDGISAKLEEIPGLQEHILTSYDESDKLAKDFMDVSEISTPEKLDQFMQPYVDECNLEVSLLDLGSVSTSTLSYYYLTTTPVTSTMFDAADVNGTYKAAVDAQMLESNTLAQRTQETVMRTQYGISATGKKEDLWKFMETINDLDTAVLIESVNISDYTFGKNAQPATDKSEMTLVISFYSVFEMDKPVVE